MSSLFEGMKASLDLATSVSVIFAILMYIRDRKSSYLKERKEREVQELIGTMERTRNSFREAKDMIFEIAIKISRLLENYGSKDELKSNLNIAEGEIAFRTAWLIDELKAEFDATIASIRDSSKKEKIKRIVKECFDKLEVSIDIGTYFMSEIKNSVFNSIDNDQVHQIIVFMTSHFLGVAVKSNQIWKIEDIKNKMEEAEKTGYKFKQETKRYISALYKENTNVTMGFGFLSSVNCFFTEISGKLAELD
mgnify:CR=1 FL=1